VSNFLNFSAASIGGFKHFSGLIPAQLGSGDVNHASVKPFHIPAANANAIFRGDIVTLLSASGGADLPPNIASPSNSVIIGNGGGSGLGNASMAPNVGRWAPADTTSVIVGVVVGFAMTLYTAKNGYQFVPASQESWVLVETDPGVEMYATVPTVPGSAFNLSLGAGIDVKANAGNQATRFGISGLSLDPATIATTATLPLRILESGEQIGNDPTQAGSVAKVTFNRTRHWMGTAAFVAD
jgi:hypothetical protein